MIDLGAFDTMEEVEAVIRRWEENHPESKAGIAVQFIGDLYEVRVLDD